MKNPVSFSSPANVLPPYGAYVHAAVVSAGTDMLFTAGQVGETPDGKIPTGVGDQYAVALRNILNILESRGAAASTIIRLTTYLVEPIAPAEMAAIRRSVLGDVTPAAILLFVPKLAGPEYLVEIEAVAAIPASRSITETSAVRVDANALR